MSEASWSGNTQYSGALKWLALVLLWPPCAGAQTFEEGRTTLSGEQHRRAAAPESVRVLDEVIEQLTEAPLYRDNDAELLIDGPATHGAMLEAIASAEHHVHLETYIFADDEVGTEFADALAAKARAGVAVRVIYDSIGSRTASGDFWAGLQAAGVAVRTFDPPDPIQDQNPFDIDTRDHRKLLIVDGRVAFTGGINIDRNYVRPSDVVEPSASSGWRDTHVRIAGPAVAAFQQLFVNFWEALDEPLAEAPYAPPPRRLDEGDALVRVLSGVGGNARSRRFGWPTKPRRKWHESESGSRSRISRRTTSSWRRLPRPPRAASTSAYSSPASRTRRCC